MQFEIRTCDADANGNYQKTCHCAEGSFINGGKNANQYSGTEKDVVNTMKVAWQQFYRNGTFPEGTLKDYRAVNGAFNVIDKDGFHQENVFAAECDALDAADNHLLNTNNFD